MRASSPARGTPTGIEEVTNRSSVPRASQRVNGDHSRLAAELEGRLGPGNADRTRELSCRNDRRRADPAWARRPYGLSAAVSRRLSPDRGCRCRRAGTQARVVPRAPVRTFDPLLQRRQCSALLLDDSSLAIQRRALVGKKLPQFRNRRVSTRRRLRERGTGKHEQRSRQPGRRAEYDQAASRSSPTPAPSAREVRATGPAVRCSMWRPIAGRFSGWREIWRFILEKSAYCRAMATRMASSGSTR